MDNDNQNDSYSEAKSTNGRYNEDYKVYCSRINFTSTAEGLKEFFEGKFGEGTVLKVDIVPNRQTGSNAGFGFLFMADEESYKKALEFDTLSDDEKTYDGWVLHTAQARKRTEGFNRDRGNSGGGGGYRSDRGGNRGHGGYGGGY